MVARVLLHSRAEAPGNLVFDLSHSVAEGITGWPTHRQEESPIIFSVIFLDIYFPNLLAGLRSLAINAPLV